MHEAVEGGAYIADEEADTQRDLCKFYKTTVYFLNMVTTYLDRRDPEAAQSNLSTVVLR